MSASDGPTLFTPLKPVDFEGLIILSLPPTMACWPQDEDNHWYCIFDPETIEARMWVDAYEFSLAERGQGAAGAEGVIAGLAHDFPDYSFNIQRTPDGFLSYCSYNEPGNPTEPEPTAAPWRIGPLTYHWWRLLRFDDAEARMADFLLLMPTPRSDAPELKELVHLLGEAIPEAIFPGIGNRI